MDGIAVRNWSFEVERLLDRCLSRSADPADLLRDVLSILTTGPAEICGPIEPRISSAGLERLLDLEAFESAALRIVGRCGFLLSRSGEGHVVASVVLPGSQDDFSFNSFSEAIALCGALVTCLHERFMAGR
jgi:hypothetical protein